MKKILIIIFISVLSTSCGKKGDPVYNKENQSKILIIEKRMLA